MIVMILLLVIIIINYILLKRINKVSKHLRQIENKIDEIYTQSRKDKYTYPKAYPFKTIKF